MAGIDQLLSNAARAALTRPHPRRGIVQVDDLAAARREFGVVFVQVDDFAAARSGFGVGFVQVDDFAAARSEFGVDFVQVDDFAGARSEFGATVAVGGAAL